MIIDLISGPRNISTALMYSFAQRSDTKVVDEPFYAAYLQRTGVQHPGRDRVLELQEADPKKVVESLLEEASNTDLLFVKNMAQHMDGLRIDWASEIAYVFLIRDPAEVITSFSKVIEQPTMRDIGVEAQVRILKEVVALGKKAIVLDMEALLKDPEKMLKALCAELGIPFQRAMLEWQAGPKEEDGVWAEYWYESVHRSTGFGTYRKKDEAVPEHLIELLADAQGHYYELKKFKLNV